MIVFADLNHFKLAANQTLWVKKKFNYYINFFIGKTNYDLETHRLRTDVLNFYLDGVYEPKGPMGKFYEDTTDYNDIAFTCFSYLVWWPR